jgi:DNA polymerase (family 10)
MEPSSAATAAQKAAELIDGLPESIEQLVKEPEKLEELPGIGERMVEHLQEIVKTGDYALRKKLLKKYPATILDLLQLQSLGPKKVAFLWSNFKAGTVADVEKIAKEGKLRDAGFWRKERTKNILKAIEVFRNPRGGSTSMRGSQRPQRSLRT